MLVPSHRGSNVFSDKFYNTEKEDKHPLSTWFCLQGGGHDDAFLMQGCTHWEFVFHKY